MRAVETPRYIDEREAEVLGSRVLRPRRARWREARAAVEGLSDPREAWEVLATRELIPAGWLEAPERTFRNGWKKHYPPSVEAARALGADADGVMAAEALLREFARRLQAFDPRVEPDAPVRWWFVPPSRNTGDLDIDARPWSIGRYARIAVEQDLGLVEVPVTDRTSDALVKGATAGAGRALIDPRRGPTKGLEVVSYFVYAAMRAVWSSRGFTRAAREAVAVPRGGIKTAAGALGRDLGGVSFAELPDVFDPLLRLWATGYAPGELDATLTLYALDPLA